MLLWRLFVTSLVVLRGTTPRGVSLTRLGKVTPSDGFGRPSRQMSEFENGLVVPENATSEQLRELPLRSSLRVTPSHGFLQTCRQLSNLEYPLVMAPNAMSDEMFPKNPTIVDLKTVFKIIGDWKADRSSKLGSVSVWCGLARSLLPMVLRHPIAKCQGDDTKSKLSWLLSKRTVPNNVALKTVCNIIGCFNGDNSSQCQSDAAWQGHSFDGFGRPCRQMSSFEKKTW